GYGQRMGYPAQGAAPGYGQQTYGQYQPSHFQHRAPAGGIYSGFSSPLGLPQGLPQPGGAQGTDGYPSNNFGVPQGNQGQQQQRNMYSNMMGSSGLGTGNFGSYSQSLGVGLGGTSQNFGGSQSLLQPIPSPHHQQQQPYMRASALPPPSTGAQQQQQYSGYPPVSSAYPSEQGAQPLPPPSQSAQSGNLATNASAYPPQPQGQHDQQQRAQQQYSTAPYGSYPPVSQQQSAYQPSSLTHPPPALAAAPQQKRPLRGDSVDSEESEYVDDGGSDDDYGGRKKRRN
ncbi:UNVERIFIED_CONTAM: hypothetical protein HDU68_008274, partial [Siphonaria sp. JEL0065]